MPSFKSCASSLLSCNSATSRAFWGIVFLSFILIGISNFYDVATTVTANGVENMTGLIANSAVTGVGFFGIFGTMLFASCKKDNGGLKLATKRDEHGRVVETANIEKGFWKWGFASLLIFLLVAATGAASYIGSGGTHGCGLGVFTAGTWMVQAISLGMIGCCIVVCAFGFVGNDALRALDKWNPKCISKHFTLEDGEDTTRTQEIESSQPDPKVSVVIPPPPPVAALKQTDPTEEAKHDFGREPRQVALEGTTTDFKAASVLRRCRRRRLVTLEAILNELERQQSMRSSTSSYVGVIVRSLTSPRDEINVFNHLRPTLS